MSVVSVTQALARCAITSSWAVGMCGQFCAAMYGYDASGYRDALTQWQLTPAGQKNPGATDHPPGALVFWGGGSAGHGHVAIADGTGEVFSIDISGPGTVSRVPAGMISSRWGLPYLGWAVPYFQGARWEPVSVHGVDVSMFQPINFLLTTPGDGKQVDFAIIKVTEGSSWTSSRWTGQRAWSYDHGLSTGFYHFARPGDMVAQADRFLSVIGTLKPGDHLWFDWEDAGVSGAQKDAWISYVQGRAAGHRVGLYCNKSFWINRDTTSFAGDGLWIADPDNPAGLPGIKSSWLIHQYSEAGGYDHDLAQFASRADMITWAEGNEDMPLSTDDKTWISNEIKKQVTALLTATSLVDSKPHGAGYYLAHAEQALAGVAAQSKTNGSSLTEIKTALAALDLSQVPAEVAAKIESLKLSVSLVEGA